MTNTRFILPAILMIVTLLDSSGVYGDERWYREYKQVVEDVSALVDWNKTDIPGYECLQKREAGIPPLGEKIVFPCEAQSPSEEIPTSAHRVRVADIKVVAAMGDSLTAGNGADACTLPEVALMARGRVSSHGCDESFESNPSLANILMRFNPNLRGYGVGRGNWDSDEAGLNVADPGDKARDMPHQAEWLIQKMKADRTVDFENDWKVVSMLIGGNDLCGWCNNIDYYSADNYVKHIRNALMILKDNMPRTIVNVVQILQVYQVDLLRSPICNIFHMGFCSCGTFLTDDEYVRFKAINEEYQTKLEADIMSGQYDVKEDFTVVLQPFLEQTSVPFLENGEPDFSYFAPDCFHLSAKGHAQGGIELWNNMLEPVGAKHREWNPGHTTIDCPTEESPYIYTNLNSDPSFSVTPAPTESNKARMTSPSIILYLILLAYLMICFYTV